MEQKLEDIRKGVAKIIGDGKFCGTGFFVSSQQCITCHHVLWKKKEIKIEILEIKRDEWLLLRDAKAQNLQLTNQAISRN